MRKAFTLIEVNLAILVMAGGILSVVALYSLGFRESRQSREDLASAAYADAVISPLVAALSSSKLSWNDFNGLKNYPGDEGWGEYLEGTGDNKDGTVVDNPTELAKRTFDDVMGSITSSKVSAGYPTESSITGDLEAGLVVCHAEGSGIVKIGFRAGKRASKKVRMQTFLSTPLYYTEVHWQGFNSEGQQ